MLRLLVFACECNSSECFIASVIAQIQKRSINATLEEMSCCAIYTAWTLVWLFFCFWRIFSLQKVFFGQRFPLSTLDGLMGILYLVITIFQCCYSNLFQLVFSSRCSLLVLNCLHFKLHTSCGPLVGSTKFYDAWLLFCYHVSCFSSSSSCVYQSSPHPHHPSFPPKWLTNNHQPLL